MLFRFVMIILACVGIIIVFLSRAESQFWLFFGLGLFILSSIALYLKKYAVYLLIPFMLVFSIILFTLNSISLHANSFQIDYIIDDPYEVRLKYGAGACTNNEKYLTEGTVRTDFLIEDSNLLFEEADFEDFRKDQIVFAFKQEPLLLGSDFILIGHIESNDKAISTWLWSRSVDILTTGDGFEEELSSLFPEEITDEDLLIINQVLEKNEYLRRLQEQLTNDKIGSIALQLNPINLNHELEVLINERVLLPKKEDHDILSYRADITANNIWNIKIMEHQKDLPSTISRLVPSFDALYLVKADPAPIMINNIILTRHFGRFGFDLIFYNWSSEDIKKEFMPVNCEMRLENDLVYLTPKGLNPSLEYHGSTKTLISEGISANQAYLLYANVVLTTIALFFYFILCLLFNKHFEHMLIAIKNIRDSLDLENTYISGITPFKLFFLAFMIIFYSSLLLPVENEIVKLVFSIILVAISVILIAYLIKDIRRVNK